MNLSNFPKQLIPIIILAVAGLAALIVARQLLVPPTFGEYGHYRAAAVDDIASREMVYAGYQACYDCHDEIFDKKQQSNHKGVACEACHGPAAKHIEAPDEFTPRAPRGRGFCPLCHGYNPSRPSGFPQIIPEVHNPGKACMSCHDPHNPLLPHAPEQCSACHREIANAKMVSHHTDLACVDCHVVTKDHMVNPRFVRAEKPKTIAVCAKCHAKNADVARNIPRVNIETHSQRYLCWDCHYPHSPEVK